MRPTKYNQSEKRRFSIELSYKAYKSCPWNCNFLPVDLKVPL